MRDEKIYLAGHTGLVGSAIFKALKDRGYTNILTASHRELDLTRQADTEAFFEREKPTYVILAAAKVGGIGANMQSMADFGYINAMIGANVIHSAYAYGVKKLLYLGSSCIYPRQCPQPMREDCLLTGIPEPTNEAYALSKILGLKLCEYYNTQYNCNFISAMPCNIYGEGDNFDEKTSHVIPALMQKMHNAHVRGEDSVLIWGTGRARREFLHVFDLALACIFLLENYDDKQFVNVGAGHDVTIAQLADMMRQVVGFRGEIVFDTSKPDGMMKKCVDTSKINGLGWKSEIDLMNGLKQTYAWFLENIVRYT